jgi:hypothetical protein
MTVHIVAQRRSSARPSDRPVRGARLCSGPATEISEHVVGKRLRDRGLAPDSYFFRYFGDPSGKTPPENAATPGAPPGAASASGGNPPHASANR